MEESWDWTDRHEIRVQDEEAAVRALPVGPLSVLKELMTAGVVWPVLTALVGPVVWTLRVHSPKHARFRSADFRRPNIGEGGLAAHVRTLDCRTASNTWHKSRA